MHLYICAMACIWTSEDNLGELVLSFHHMSPRHGAQVISPGSKRLHLLSPPSGPQQGLFQEVYQNHLLSF